MSEEGLESTGKPLDFQTLYRKAMPILFRVALSFLGDADAAEDAAHAAFIKMQERRQVFNDSDHALYWLIRVVMNESRSILRHQRVLELLPLGAEGAEAKMDAALADRCSSVTPGEKSPEELFFEGQETERLHKALRHLPKQYQEVLFLREYAGFQYPDIAEMLECSEVTVRKRVSRARSSLIAYFGDKAS